MHQSRLEEIIKDKIEKVERRKNELTAIDGCVGIDIRCDNDFYRQYLKPYKFPFEYIGGKIGLATCTDATILIPQELFSKFLRKIEKYARRYKINPEITIKTQEYNFFLNEEIGKYSLKELKNPKSEIHKRYYAPVTYLHINDPNIVERAIEIEVSTSDDVGSIAKKIRGALTKARKGD